MDSVYAQLPLRDIHLPPPVSWWPPAWGWWLLCALLLAGLLVALWRWWCRRPYSTRRRLRAAREELDRIERQFAGHDPAALVRELSIWLRRVALTFHGRETAALTGAAWVEWWRRHGDPELFDARLGKVLSIAPYRRNVDPGQARCLLDACRASLEQVSVGSS